MVRSRRLVSGLEGKSIIAVLHQTRATMPAVRPISVAVGILAWNEDTTIGVAIDTLLREHIVAMTDCSNRGDTLVARMERSPDGLMP